MVGWFLRDGFGEPGRDGFGRESWIGYWVGLGFAVVSGEDEEEEKVREWGWFYLGWLGIGIEESWVGLVGLGGLGWLGWLGWEGWVGWVGWLEGSLNHRFIP